MVNTTSVFDRASTAEPPAYGLFVGGRPTVGSGVELVLIGRRDGDVIGRVSSAAPADVTAAYEVAAAAQPGWAAVPPGGRAAVLMRAAQLFRERAGDIGAAISAEMGKPIGEAITEVEKGAAVLEYYAQSCYGPTGETFVTDTGEDVMTFRSPLGVVALITPWNFPFTLPVRKVAAALATGNAALLKPATNAALCGLAIGVTLADAGLPPGVLNVIIGESRVIQEALLQDPRLAAVSLTGSYPTAAAIRRLLPLHVPFQAELGGKNALVIWRDADIDHALPLIWASSFRNNGQICTSSGRLLVHDDIADELLARLRADIESRPWSTADGDYGILSSERERSNIVDTLDRNAASVSERITPSWDEPRFGPTVLVDPEPGELLEEEIFGPVLTFERVSSLGEAIGRANSTAYGLTAGIVTNDLDVAKAFWHGSTAGTVKVNAPLTGTPFHVPLQGWGHSGADDGEGGATSLEFFTRRKAVHVRRAPAR